MRTPRKVKVYKGGIVKLPSEVRMALGLKPGDELLIYVERGRAVLVPPSAEDPVEELSSTLGPGVDEDELLEKATEELREKLTRLRG